MIIAVAFGTTIAANYAIQNPGRVRGMILVAWSEIARADAVFPSLEEYNRRSTEVLETRPRGADVAAARRWRQTIYGVIPLDSPVREK